MFATLQYHQTIYHAFSYSCTYPYRSRCHPLADQHLYTHGPQDQRHSECRCGNSGRTLAAAGFWRAQYRETVTYISRALHICESYKLFA